MSRRIPLRDLPQFDEVREKNARMVKCITICAVALFIVVGIWIACISTKVHEIVLTDEAGEVIGTYVGRAANNIPNGQGEVTLTDGTLVRGRFDSGKPSGIMECTFPIGSHYKGMLSEDFRPMGKGTYTYVSGEICEAEDWMWVEEDEDERRLGEDTVLYVYTGMKRDHKALGYGIAVNVAQPSFSDEGEWKNNKRHGLGRYMVKGSFTLEGVYENGVPTNDEMTFIYENGEAEPLRGKYDYVNQVLEQGIYKGHEFQGYTIDGEIVYGNLTFTTNGTYNGTFVNGIIRAEKASYVNKDQEEILLDKVRWVEKQTMPGGKYTGILANGVRQGYGIVEWEDGDLYLGEFLDGKYSWGAYSKKEEFLYGGYFDEKQQFCGQGTMSYADGSVYEGEWKDNLRHDDNGRYTDKNGNVFVGTFADGEMKEGTWTYADGTVKEIQY